MTRHASTGRSRFAFLSLACLAAVSQIGCGSSSSDKVAGGSPPAPPRAPATAAPVHVAADAHGGLSFASKKLTAKAGQVKLVMTNPGSSGVAHGIAVEGSGVDKDGPVVPAGATSSVQVALKPGRYTFYCPVKAHEAAGMKGTLTVH